MYLSIIFWRNKYLTRHNNLMNVQLAYLPHRRRDLLLDDEIVQLHINLDKGTKANDELKEDTKTKKPGLLDRLKPRVCLLL